jgi:hypothetical protein
LFEQYQKLTTPPDESANETEVPKKLITKSGGQVKKAKS